MQFIETSRPLRVQVNANYYSLGDTLLHCGEMQDALFCEHCDEMVGCIYCEVDHTEAHDCEGI